MGAGVIIVAQGGGEAFTEAVCAAVPHGAGVAVVAGVIDIYLVHTPFIPVTEVHRARVSVVAGHGVARGACAELAGVGDGAGIAVITVLKIGGGHAAALRVAGVVRAGVLIVAGDGLSSACAIRADVLFGARGAVVTGGVLLVEEHAAALTVTGVVRARIVVSTGVFVRLTVAVVVQAVALLQLGSLRVAR